MTAQTSPSPLDATTPINPGDPRYIDIGHFDPKPTPVDPSSGSNGPPWTQPPPTIPTAPITGTPAAQLGPVDQYKAVLPSDQLNQLLDPNSLLVRQATANANEASNAKGLLNSSMAVGAAQGAVLQAAMPLAYENANAANAVGLANSSAKNAANLQQGQFSQQSGLATSAALNAEVMANLDQANKIQLAGIQTQYQAFLNANSNASGLYDQYMKQIGDIQNNANLDQATKTNMINQITDALRSGLAMLSGINGFDLAKGLNFGNPKDPKDRGNPVTPPPPPPASPTPPDHRPGTPAPGPGQPGYDGAKEFRYNGQWWWI